MIGIASHCSTRVMSTRSCEMRSRAEWTRSAHTGWRHSIRRITGDWMASARWRRAMRQISTFSTDFETVEVETVLFRGRIVAYRGEMVVDLPETSRRTSCSTSCTSVRCPSIRSGSIRNMRSRPIVVYDGQIVTGMQKVTPVEVDGAAVADVESDFLKVACIERHKATGRVGVGYVRGFGLQRGAIASSIAHDAHNIVVVGTSRRGHADRGAAGHRDEGRFGDRCRTERSLAGCRLPIGGIMSDQSLAVVRSISKRWSNRPTISVAGSSLRLACWLSWRFRSSRRAA